MENISSISKKIKSNAIILSALIISIALIISTNIISDKIYRPSKYPSSLSLYDKTKVIDYNKPFLSEYEASEFLRISQTNIKEMIRAGKLKGTFMVIKQMEQGYELDKYVFSTKKLEQIIMGKIEKGEQTYINKEKEVDEIEVINE